MADETTRQLFRQRPVPTGITHQTPPEEIQLTKSVDRSACPPSRLKESARPCEVIVPRRQDLNLDSSNTPVLQRLVAGLGVSQHGNAAQHEVKRQRHHQDRGNSGYQPSQQSLASHSGHARG